jgi:cobalt-zinc-cadmium efflux system outer membrane protein
MRSVRVAALLLGSLFFASLAGAQEAPPAPSALHFSLGSYLQAVAQGNLELAATRVNASIAQAQIAVAKVFPDPLLTGGLQQVDVTGQGNPTASVVALTVPLQIGGQRGARVAVAEAGADATNAEIEDALRLLRGAAANAYVDGLYARLVVDRKKRTLASLERLVSVNEIRLKAGDVGEAVLVQSRVEAQQFRAQVIASEGDVRAADLNLLYLLGRAGGTGGANLELAGGLEGAAEHAFTAESLLAGAMERRPDMIAARRRLDQAQRQIRLARANRIPDIALGAVWQHNFPITGLPTSDLLGGTLTIPLPFSRVYRGELDAAYGGELQNQWLTKSVAVKVETEVRQALVAYETAAARVKVYTGGGVLADADAVLEKSFFNYQRGGATFVEVLVAQRTVNDVYLSYYDAMASAAHALVALEQAVASSDLPL